MKGLQHPEGTVASCKDYSVLQGRNFYNPQRKLGVTATPKKLSPERA